MGQKFTDAYPPENSADFTIVKFTSSEVVKTNQHFGINRPDVTEEYFRIPNENLQKLRDPKQSEFKGDFELMKKLKDQLGGVQTDILDQDGNQQPGFTTTKISGAGATVTKIHLKNDKVHSPRDRNGFYLPARLEKDEHGATITKFAAENRYNNVIQPDGTFEFADTKRSAGGKVMARTSIIHGSKENLKGQDGQTILAYEQYESATGSVVCHASFVGNKEQSVTLENGKIIPSFYKKSGGEETILHHEAGEPHSPVNSDGLHLPSKAVLYEGELVEADFHDHGVKKNMDGLAQHTTWHRTTGNLRSVSSENDYSNDETGNIPAFKPLGDKGVSALSVAENGDLVDAGRSAKYSLPRAELMTLAKQNVDFFSAVAQQRAGLLQTIKTSTQIGQ